MFVSAAANTAELLSPLLIDSTSSLGTELQSPVRAVPGYLEQCPLVAAVITVYASVMTVMCLLWVIIHMDGLIATNTGDTGDSIHTSALGATPPGEQGGE